MTCRALCEGNVKSRGLGLQPLESVDLGFNFIYLETLSKFLLLFFPVFFLKGSFGQIS